VSRRKIHRQEGEYTDKKEKYTNKKEKYTKKKKKLYMGIFNLNRNYSAILATLQAIMVE
jgi:hypothetical protein